MAEAIIILAVKHFFASQIPLPEQGDVKEEPGM